MRDGDDAPALPDPLWPRRILARGVYRAPYLVGGRPVLNAVTAAGELATVRRVGERETMRGAWADMEAWLDGYDPAPPPRPVLRLVH